MCRWTGYGFRPLCPKQGIYSRTSLFRTRLIRSPRYFEGRSNALGFTLPLYTSPVISNFFSISLGTLKQQGSTVIQHKSVLNSVHDLCESVLIISRARVVLNRVCIVGIFCPKLGQGFKPSATQLYRNIGRLPPPPPPLPRAASRCFGNKRHVSQPQVATTNVWVKQVCCLAMAFRIACSQTLYFLFKVRRTRNVCVQATFSKNRFLAHFSMKFKVCL